MFETHIILNVAEQVIQPFEEVRVQLIWLFDTPLCLIELRGLFDVFDKPAKWDSLINGLDGPLDKVQKFIQKGLI